MTPVSNAKGKPKGLRAVQPDSVNSPRRAKMAIFGVAGVGKTYVSLDFPGAYYIDVEEGAKEDHYKKKLKDVGAVYFGREQGSLNFDDVIDELNRLATNEHNYKTVIIDSFTKLYNHAAGIAEEEGGSDYGRDKKEANKPTRRLLMAVDRLDMNVIFICHEKGLWGMNAKGEREEIDQTFDGYDPKLGYELDLIMQIIRRSDKQRFAVIKKSRLLEFPEQTTIPWSYEEFAKKFGRQYLESEHKVIALASEESVDRLESLIKAVRVEKTDIDKWLSKAGVTCFAEMTEEQVEKCIKHLAGKLPKE